MAESLSGSLTPAGSVGSFVDALDTPRGSARTSSSVVAFSDGNLGESSDSASSDSALPHPRRVGISEDVRLPQGPRAVFAPPEATTVPSPSLPVRIHKQDLIMSLTDPKKCTPFSPGSLAELLFEGRERRVVEAAVEQAQVLLSPDSSPTGSSVPSVSITSPCNDDWFAQRAERQRLRLEKLRERQARRARRKRKQRQRV